ncbi:unnamed protein product, partial [Polarella glacialis]
ALAAALSGVAVSALPLPALAVESKAELTEILRKDRALLATLPGLLQAQEWEAVRQVLKAPPVNYLWNLGESKNTVKKVGEVTDDASYFDLAEELSGALQLCDQFTYDNVFIPFQPGNGKVKIKEPTEQVTTAIATLDGVLKALS